jgi:hypothetical protein
MNRSLYARLCFVALSLAMLPSCGPTTQLTSSWSDPAFANRGYKKIVVVGASPVTTIRRMYEDTFVADLKSRGVEGISSYTVVGEEQPIDKEVASAKLKEAGVDAVIVTRLIDRESVETYYPPTYSSVAAPGPYYGGWYNYYSVGYTYMSSPGYVVEDQIYKIETNLYDVETDKLVWSGLTETTLSSGYAPEGEVKPLVTLLLTEMEKKQLMPPKMKS